MGFHGDVCVVGEMNPTLTSYIGQLGVARQCKTVLNVVCPCLSCVLSHLVNLCLFLYSRSYLSFWFLAGQELEGHHPDSNQKTELNTSQRCS